MGSLCLRTCGFEGQWTRCACGLEVSKVNGHTSLRSLCFLSCGFEDQWTQLAPLTVLAVFRIRRSMDPARFARCACGLADSKINRHSSLRLLCLWSCGFEYQWAQPVPLYLLNDHLPHTELKLLKRSDAVL